MKVPKIKDIRSAVEMACGVHDLTTKRKTLDIARARKIFFVICDDYGITTKKSSSYLKKSRGTPLAAIKVHNVLIKTNQLYQNNFKMAKNILKGKVVPNEHTLMFNRHREILSEEVRLLDEEGNIKFLSPEFLVKLSMLSQKEIIDFEKNRLDPYLLSRNKKIKH